MNANLASPGLTNRSAGNWWIAITIVVLSVVSGGCGGGDATERPTVDSTSSAVLEQALAALGAGNYNRALALANEVEERQPGLTETNYVKGQIYFDLRLFDQARQYWSNAQRAEPDYWLWSHNLGELAFQQGRFREAESHYRRAADLDPNPASLHGLASTYWEIGMRDSTAQVLRRAITLDPKFAPVHLSLSSLAEEQGNLDEALDYAHQAVDLDSTNTEHQLAAGVLDFKVGQIEEAMVHLGRVLAREPGNATALYNYGQALQQTGERDEAATFLEAAETAREQEQGLGLLRQAVANNPLNPQNQIALAQALHATGRIDEAIRSYKAADLLAPGDSRLQHTIATLHLQRGELNEAIRRYREIIAVDSTMPEAWLNMGLAYARMDSMEHARAIWTDAGRLFPENESVRQVLERMKTAGS